MKKIFAGCLVALLLVGLMAGCGALTGVGGTAAAEGSAVSARAVTLPSLGAAAGFAILGNQAVTLTDSVVTGDVGVDLGGAVTQTNSTVTGTIHLGDALAQQAYDDSLTAYAALALEPVDQYLSGTLANVTLGPGVYGFVAAATLTGVLTLDAMGDPNAVWVFKIGTGGTGALTGTGFSVVMANGANPCNVYWWVAQAVTMTTSNLQGTVLAGAAITVTGGTFNGNAYSQAGITLTGANLAGCDTNVTVPPIEFGSIKVTGGGQISVPAPDSSDPDAIGSGKATFGFNAQPDKSGSGAKGNFNYVNHVTGLHINGDVDNVEVIETNVDGSPRTVLFSGSYDGGFFIVTVEDHGEPGRNDRLSVMVSGVQSELRNIRVISKGNIQFHK